VATTISVSLDDEVASRLEEELDYGDNRSQIVNGLLREYLGMEAEA
jgi:metal-responsive CopG/Arc/MetJ family transcriptional regulator